MKRRLTEAERSEYIAGYEACIRRRNLEIIVCSLVLTMIMTFGIFMLIGTIATWGTLSLQKKIGYVIFDSVTIPASLIGISLTWIGNIKENNDDKRKIQLLSDPKYKDEVIIIKRD